MRILLVLVANVADNLFKQILDRHQARDAAIFIDHDAHVLLLALHLAQQFVAALRLRHKYRRMLDARDGSDPRFFIGNLQQIVRKCDPGDGVERSLVDRHARKIVLLQHFEKVLERDRLRNRKHLRARRHHLAHQLVAKLDRRAHQFAVALFENSFFFARLEQRLHIGRGLVFFGNRLLGQRRDREEEADDRRDRRHQPQQQSNRPHQPRRPAALGMREQQRRQNLVAEDHSQHDHQHCLRNLGIRGPRCVRSAIEQHRANRQREHRKRKLLQHRGAQSGMLARKPDQRLDLFFPLVEIVLHLARQNLAELRIHAADVRREGLHQRRDHQKRDGEPAHGRAPFCMLRIRTRICRSIRPWGRRSLARSFCSRRAISPLSVSWSYPARWSNP